LTGVASLSAGCKFMCAQLAAGGAKCWGENGNGQLGDGTNNDSSTPVDVKGITDATYVASGFDSACAAFPNGVQCWGQDSSGQLGDGKQNDSSVPVDATQVTFGPTILASGAYHVFAYGLGPSAQSAFASWGANPSTGGLKGTLDGATAGNNFTCALQQGSALCWGQNDQGQLGRGAKGPSDPNAAQINGLVGVTEVRAGYDHACAFVGPYKMKCWGNNTNGELGNNSTTEGDAPVDVQSWP
jgi:alpha-tubulin suppressor-like RCC1 family protein